MFKSTNAYVMNLLCLFTTLKQNNNNKKKKNNDDDDKNNNNDNNNSTFFRGLSVLVGEKFSHGKSDRFTREKPAVTAWRYPALTYPWR